MSSSPSWPSRVLQGDSFSTLTFVARPARKTIPDIVVMKDGREGGVGGGEMNGDKNLAKAMRRTAARGGTGGAAPHLRGARARGRVAGGVAGAWPAGGARGRDQGRG